MILSSSHGSNIPQVGHEMTAVCGISNHELVTNSIWRRQAHNISTEGRCEHLQFGGPEGNFRCHHRISVSELPATFTEQKRVPERANAGLGTQRHRAAAAGIGASLMEI